MYTELRAHIPMSTTHGEGYAIAVIDYSEEHHLLWVVVLDDTGAIWAVPNPEVRVRPNASMGARRHDAETFQTQATLMPSL